MGVQAELTEKETVVIIKFLGGNAHGRRVKAFDLLDVMYLVDPKRPEYRQEYQRVGETADGSFLFLFCGVRLNEHRSDQAQG